MATGIMAGHMTINSPAFHVPFAGRWLYLQSPSGRIALRGSAVESLTEEHDGAVTLRTVSGVAYLIHATVDAVADADSSTVLDVLEEG